MRRRCCHEDIIPLVEVLDVLVPHMVDAVPVTDGILQRTLEQIGGNDVEQLIEVPKLPNSDPNLRPCLHFLEPQTAEQLVEVPVHSLSLSTSVFLLPQGVEQLVGVPPMVCSDGGNAGGRNCPSQWKSERNCQRSVPRVLVEFG